RSPPAHVFAAPRERRAHARLHFRVRRQVRHQNADPAHPFALLRARRERPRCRVADEGDELAAPHSITSLARASNVVGTVRPSALAVLILIASSYWAGACRGRAAGLSPFGGSPPLASCWARFL